MKKTYQETLEWMFQQLPMFQRIGKQAFKKDLTNTLKLASHLKNPQDNFKSIHVGGTNGKGSVSNMLASIFQEAGYKTGLYTSPHLKDFRERIRIDGKQIPEETVVDFIEKNQNFLETNRLSFFEMTVGMAFDFFAKNKVDIAIIEVGLGGRLDSTNIITPELSIITNIGLDHTAFLGDSVEEIAVEKAGIIKKEVPVVIGEFEKTTSQIFKEKAMKLNSEIFFAKDFKFPKLESDLKGSYQKKNIETTLTSIKILKEGGWNLTEEAVTNGLLKVKLNTGFRGRWEVLNEKPKVICDTAHNAEGLKYVMKQLLEERYTNLHIVLGVVNDKDLSKILSLFPKTAQYYFARPNIPRGLAVKELLEQSKKHGLVGRPFSSVSKAYEAAIAAALDQDLIFVGGSNFTVAEII